MILFYAVVAIALAVGLARLRRNSMERPVARISPNSAPRRRSHGHPAVTDAQVRKSRELGYRGEIPPDSVSASRLIDELEGPSRWRPKHHRSTRLAPDDSRLKPRR